ncbi:MAG TPA: thioredoxin family protein [Steroidobacteraceae bacterium]
MKSSPLILAAAVVPLLLAACDRRKEEPPPPPQPRSTAAQAPDAHLPAGIAWFDGGVDAAFAAAKAANKPVFLYWGAEWCPPCARVKSTIFNKREFQERSRLFVPVYLDGDTPSAQKHGEHFGVVGYPTMILFRPDGTEITRLPGDVDIARYATILDVALADARPVSEIIAAARQGGDVPANDWRLLAYYSWGTDSGRAVPQDQQLSTLRTLSQRCPAELTAECSRLFFGYVLAAADAAEGDKPALDGLERADARRRLLALLAMPAVQAANVDHLLYVAKPVVTTLTAAGSSERHEVTRAWNAALDQVGAPGGAVQLNVPEQLNAIRVRIVLARLDAPDGAAVPPALLDQARKAVAEADAKTTDVYARQAAMNAAANLYWEAGLDAESNRLLTAELEKSSSPYYFMLDLADLAQKAGRKQEAVQWLARAYAGAKGPATRFQWGYNYLVGLLEMTPEDTQAIERAGLAVLGELDGSPDAFYQRTRMRLEQLDAKLLEWGKTGEAAKVVATLRARTRSICSKLPADDPGRRNCEKFLNPPAAATRTA